MKTNYRNKQMTELQKDLVDGAACLAFLGFIVLACLVFG